MGRLPSTRRRRRRRGRTRRGNASDQEEDGVPRGGYAAFPGREEEEFSGVRVRYRRGQTSLARSTSSPRSRRRTAGSQRIQVRQQNLQPRRRSGFSIRGRPDQRSRGSTTTSEHDLPPKNDSTTFPPHPPSFHQPRYPTQQPSWTDGTVSLSAVERGEGVFGIGRELERRESKSKSKSSSIKSRWAKYVFGGLD